jgi:hypothetical protein
LQTVTVRNTNFREGSPLTQVGERRAVTPTPTARTPVAVPSFFPQLPRSVSDAPVGEAGKLVPQRRHAVEADSCTPFADGRRPSAAGHLVPGSPCGGRGALSESRIQRAPSNSKTPTAACRLSFLGSERRLEPPSETVASPRRVMPSTPRASEVSVPIVNRPPKIASREAAIHCSHSYTSCSSVPASYNTPNQRGSVESSTQAVQGETSTTPRAFPGRSANRETSKQSRPSIWQGYEDTAKEDLVEFLVEFLRIRLAKLPRINPREYESQASLDKDTLLWLAEMIGESDADDCAMLAARRVIGEWPLEVMCCRRPLASRPSFRVAVVVPVAPRKPMARPIIASVDSVSTMCTSLYSVGSSTPSARLSAP